MPPATVAIRVFLETWIIDLFVFHEGENCADFF